MRWPNTPGGHHTRQGPGVPGRGRPGDPVVGGKLGQGHELTRFLKNLLPPFFFTSAHQSPCKEPTLGGAGGSRCPEFAVRVAVAKDTEAWPGKGGEDRAAELHIGPFAGSGRPAPFLQFHVVPLVWRLVLRVSSPRPASSEPMPACVSALCSVGTRTQRLGERGGRLGKGGGASPGWRLPWWAPPSASRCPSLPQASAPGSSFLRPGCCSQSWRGRRALSKTASFDSLAPQKPPSLGGLGPSEKAAGGSRIYPAYVSQIDSKAGSNVARVSLHRCNHRPRGALQRDPGGRSGALLWIRILGIGGSERFYPRLLL